MILDREALSEDLYHRQFSLYVDNILASIDLQIEAYGKEENIPHGSSTYFGRNSVTALIALKTAHGPVVAPEHTRHGRPPEDRHPSHASSMNRPGGREISAALSA